MLPSHTNAKRQTKNCICFFFFANKHGHLRVTGQRRGWLERTSARASSLTFQYLKQKKKRKRRQAMAQLSLIIIKQTIIMCFHPLPPRSIDFYSLDSIRMENENEKFIRSKMPSNSENKIGQLWFDLIMWAKFFIYFFPFFLFYFVALGISRMQLRIMCMFEKRQCAVGGCVPLKRFYKIFKNHKIVVCFCEIKI